MQIQWAQGDYGRQYPIQLYPIDGKQFTYADLATADFHLKVYHKDKSVLPLQDNSEDNSIVLSKYAKIHLYKVSDKIVMDGESMTITEIDKKGLKLKVSRTNPIPHKKNACVKHIVYESDAAVTYEPSTYRVIFETQSDMELYPGKYIYEIAVETTDRQATCTGSRPDDIFTIKVIENTEGL